MGPLMTYHTRENGGTTFVFRAGAVLWRVRRYEQGWVAAFRAGDQWYPVGPEQWASEGKALAWVAWVVDHPETASLKLEGLA